MARRPSIQASPVHPASGGGAVSAHVVAMAPKRKHIIDDVDESCSSAIGSAMRPTDHAGRAQPCFRAASLAKVSGAFKFMDTFVKEALSANQLPALPWTVHNSGFQS